jgi:hypothetical protein
LGSWSLDSTAAAAVEKPEMDAGFISDKTHYSAQGINLSHKLPFGQAAYRRVAGHLGNRLKMDGDEASIKAHDACRVGSFAAGVAGADDDNLVFIP